MPSLHNPWPRLLLLATILAAFALRAYHLDHQSLFSDEAISLNRSSLPLADMLAQMPIEHTPGYFVLLRGWMALAGISEVALRFLSLLPSVWAVALIYRMATDLGSARAGVVAALLLAVNPFQVWYGQEARMYSWLAASALLSSLTCWRLLVAPHPGPPQLREGDRRTSRLVWTLYVLSTTAAIYLHYYGFLVPLSHTVFAGVRLLQRANLRGLVRWAWAGVAVAALFAPWLLRLRDLLGFEGWRDPLDPARVPWMMLQSYSAGRTMPAPLSEWLPWVYLALATVGVWAWSRRNAAAGWFLGITTLSAFAVVMALIVRQPDFHPRYSIYLATLLTLLVAGGVTAPELVRWRRGALIPALLTVLLIGGAVPGLARLYHDPLVQKPDFRGAAQRIEQGTHPGDVILVDGPNPDLSFGYHYAGNAPVVDVPDLSDVTWDELGPVMQAMVGDAPRVWELLFFHPPAQAQVWLATQAWASEPTYHNGVRVTLYGLDGPNLVTRPHGVAFGPALTLVQSAVQGPTVPRGALLRVTTDWFTEAPAPDYKFSLRLVTPDGHILASDDYVPQNWFAPTPQWVVGAPAQDRRALLLPADLPPGPTLITLRLYDAATGVPVDTAAGQDVVLGEVEVTP